MSTARPVRFDSIRFAWDVRFKFKFELDFEIELRYNPIHTSLFFLPRIRMESTVSTTASAAVVCAWFAGVTGSCGCVGGGCTWLRGCACV